MSQGRFNTVLKRSSRLLSPHISNERHRFLAVSILRDVFLLYAQPECMTIDREGGSTTGQHTSDGPTLLVPMGRPSSRPDMEFRLSY